MTPSRRWAVLLWAVAGAALFSAVLLGAYGYGSWAYGEYLDEHGIPARARVIDAGVTSVSVEFANQRGTRSVADVRWWAPDIPEIGDEVGIVFDPWDPRDAVRVGRMENRIVAVVATAGALGTLSVAAGSGVGAALVHRARRS